VKAIYSSLTDKGISRDHNEDFFLNNEKYSLCMVADGMGGYQCGDIASKLALESIINYIDNYTNKTPPFYDKVLINAIDYANSNIQNFQKTHTEVKSMGTTFIGLTCSDQGAMAVHIGDSRLYQLRAGKIKKITKDHSAEQDVLPDFMQNANNGKYSSVLTRALGTDKKALPDFTFFDFQINDTLLLCSDGLYSMVNDDKLKEILNSSQTLSEKCRKLIAEANNNGGEDNITATLVKIISIENNNIFELNQEK